MKRYICRAIIDGKKVSFPVYARSFDSALSGAYRHVVGCKHGELLTLSEGEIIYA